MCGWLQAVGIRGAHKGYQLKQADLTCSSVSDLTVYNVRRLFANKGNEFMDHCPKFKGPGGSGRRVLNATLEPTD